MEKNVTLGEVLKKAAESYVVPEETKNKIWANIQAKMSEPKVEEPTLYDGDYPPFGTDISELV